MLEKQGAFRHNPQRRRTPPKGRGKLPGEPPEDLDLERWETKAWKEIVRSIPPGVATGSEIILVEVAARLLGRLRRSVDLNGSQISQLRYILTDLGCSPAARERLGLPESDEDDGGFGEFSPARAAAPPAKGAAAKSKTLRFPGAPKR